ncbi:MAG: hypothetical protein ACRC1H_04385 [Caldilineaceae bacterium]
MSTSNYLTDTVKDMAPWRKGIRWWVVLLQGLVLAAMGGFGLWRPEQAGIGISLALAALLVVQAVWVIVSAMRGREYGMSVFNLLAAGGGLVAGIGILVPYLFQADFDLQTAWANFGLGLAIVGLLTLASSFVERPNRGVAWATLVRGLFNLGFGAYIFWVAASGNTDNPLLIRWLSIALLVLGGVLIVWSILLYVRRPKPEADAKQA